MPQILHAFKKTFRAHKVTPLEKTSTADAEFENVHDIYKTLRKDVESIQTSAKACASAWEKLGQTNLNFLKAYETNFDTTPPEPKKGKVKKIKTKALELTTSAAGIKKESLPKEVIPGEENDGPSSIMDPASGTKLENIAAANVLLDDNLESPVYSHLNEEEAQIQENQPAQLLDEWNNQNQQILTETGKLPGCLTDFNEFMKMLDRVDAQISKRSKIVHELDYYRGKHKDLENDKKKSPNEPKQKIRIYQAEAYVKAHDENFEEMTRVCLDNMKKCIYLRKELVLRATGAFLSSQAEILNAHPFKSLHGTFLENHPDLKGDVYWTSLNFETERLPGEKYKSGKVKEIGAASDGEMDTSGDSEEEQDISSESSESESESDVNDKGHAEKTKSKENSPGFFEMVSNYVSGSDADKGAASDSDEENARTVAPNPASVGASSRSVEAGIKKALGTTPGSVAGSDEKSRANHDEKSSNEIDFSNSNETASNYGSKGVNLEKSSPDVIVLTKNCDCECDCDCNDTELTKGCSEDGRANNNSEVEHLNESSPDVIVMTTQTTTTTIID
eukprot:Awhi_evm1s10908